MPGTLTHSPADVIRRVLIDLGHGVDPTDGGSWPIFVSSEPTTPDSAITVYDTAGRKDGRIMFNGRQHIFHGIQVRVRALKFETGYNKANAIAVALDEDIRLRTVTLNDPTGTSTTTYTVYSVSRDSDVLPIGTERPRETQAPISRRQIFTINASVMVEES